jgi:hypothetical protein
MIDMNDTSKPHFYRPTAFQLLLRFAAILPEEESKSVLPQRCIDSQRGLRIGFLHHDETRKENIEKLLQNCCRELFKKAIETYNNCSSNVDLFITQFLLNKERSSSYAELSSYDKLICIMQKLNQDYMDYVVSCDQDHIHNLPCMCYDLRLYNDALTAAVESSYEENKHNIIDSQNVQLPISNIGSAESSRISKDKEGEVVI